MFPRESLTNRGHVSPWSVEVIWYGSDISAESTDGNRIGGMMTMARMSGSNLNIIRTLDIRQPELNRILRVLIILDFKAKDKAVYRRVNRMGFTVVVQRGGHS